MNILYMILAFLAGGVAGFVGGFLVYRKNGNKFEVAYAEGQKRLQDAQKEIKDLRDKLKGQ